MLNKYLTIFIFLLTGCSNYNPDSGKFIKFRSLNLTQSNTVLIDKVQFKGTDLNNTYKNLIVRQIKSDLANASSSFIYDYNEAFKQNTLKDPDFIINFKITLNESDEKISFYTPVSKYESTTTTSRRGKGSNSTSSSSQSTSKSESVIKLPLNYGICEVKILVSIFDRNDLSLSYSKKSNLIKSYISNNYKENYPFFNNSFIIDNIHEISGLVVNSILFSSKNVNRKIEKTYGELFLYNIQEGLIQKELKNLEKKIAYTNDFQEKSVFYYYLGIIHEIIGQPLIAYDYYEKSIEHDYSNNLSHLAVGDIDRDRRL